MQNDENVKNIICECGGSYTLKNKATHNRTKKHLKFIQPTKVEEESNQNTCICNGYYLKKNKQQHMRTEKHQNYMKHEHKYDINNKQFKIEELTKKSIDELFELIK